MANNPLYLDAGATAFAQLHNSFDTIYARILPLADGKIGGKIIELDRICASKKGESLVLILRARVADADKQTLTRALEATELAPESEIAALLTPVEGEGRKKQLEETPAHNREYTFFGYIITNKSVETAVNASLPTTPLPYAGVRTGHAQLFLDRLPEAVYARLEEKVRAVLEAVRPFADQTPHRKPLKKEKEPQVA